MFKKISPYILNILWLFSLLLLIGWLIGIEPFGEHTLLTIDLKQQYLEFFGYFRQTLLTQPDGFVYSFSKGIGGNMLGLWAYYLLSPFNFLFLFVPITALPQMITVVIVLKLLAMSSCFFYFVRQRYQLDTIMGICFSTCYALSAYVVTYYSNVMWLDALILLPIVALGLHQLLHQRKWQLYVGTLAFSIMTNYYIGYMVCVFLAMYAIYVWSESHTQWNWRVFWQDYCRFVGYSILAVALASIVLVPTVMALLSSKANYAQSQWNLDTAYTWRDVLAKSFIGSFKLDEIRRGSPQIYVGMGSSLLALYYFVSRPIRHHEKGIAALIISVFSLAFYFKFIDRLWHAGQFPVWYPFRFSFLWCFFILILAMKAWQHRATFTKLHHGIATSIMMVTLSYYWFNSADFMFLTRHKVALSIVFIAVYGIVILFAHKKAQLIPYVLLMMASSELVANAYVVIPKFELADASDTYQQITAIKDEIADIPVSESFSRVYTNFNRSRNDALLFAYHGVSHFSSTTQTTITQLFAHLGLAQTSTSAHYTAGTLFTDDLLGIEHLLTLKYPKDIPLNTSATDMDLAFYPIVHQSQHFERRHNANHLGLGVATSSTLGETTFVENQPILNQEALIEAIAGAPQSLFKEVALTPAEMSNLVINNQHYQKAQSDKEASLVYHFETSSTNPYYIVLPKTLSHKQVKFYLNGKKLHFYPNFIADQIIAISQGQIGEQHIEIHVPKQQVVHFNELKLYEFNRASYEALNFNRFVTTSFTNHQIEGQIDIAPNQAYVLFSIPYDKNWHVTVNHQDVQSKAVLNGTLLAVPVQSGKQHITLTYQDHSLLVGGSVTFITCLFCFWLTYRQKHTP